MNDNNDYSTIFDCFADVGDPRILKKTSHELLEIIALTVCAVTGGADSWVDIEMFGKCKIDWFKTFLKLPNGIPSHDTLGRVFSLISAEEFQAAFSKWIETINAVTQGEIVAIDGKTLRRSYDTASGKGAIHMVSAWATEQGVVLGQIKTAEKSNEITAIPNLLKKLHLKGCIVSIDAMGCQKSIADEILAQEADYLLALKGNQGNMYNDVKESFESALNDKSSKYYYKETKDANHGRNEIRKYYVMGNVEDLPEYDYWPALSSICMVESHRQQGDSLPTVERRYYLSSLAAEKMEHSHAIRKHWGIENSLHWVLDVSFREDESRIRKGAAAENLAVVRHLALCLLKEEKSRKVGVAAKRKRAGWDNNYLCKVLTRSGK
jgi:predicted transposase YbfD/YdcC